MNRGWLIFPGILLTFASSWLGMVLVPYWQLRDDAPLESTIRDELYPQPLAGQALTGQHVYQANGCMFCHTQQVRSARFGSWVDESGDLRSGADIKRSWGLRRTVARDYIYDAPAMIGTQRTGPDLANIGMRNGSAAWHHLHLFNPRAANAWSNMPSFAYLYSRERIHGSRSEKALNLAREWTMRPGKRWQPSMTEWNAILAARGDAIVAGVFGERPPDWFDLSTREGKEQLLNLWLTTPEEEYQVVPTYEADALAAYLLSLRKAETPVPEAKE